MQHEDITKPFIPPRTLVDLDDSMNFSPIRGIKFITTTNAKVQQDLKNLRDKSNPKLTLEEKVKQRVFKFNVNK